MAAPHHPVYFWDPPLDLDCSCVGESISLLSSFCKSSAFTSVLFLINPYYQGDVNHGWLQHCQGSLSGLSALFCGSLFSCVHNPWKSILLHSPLSLSCKHLLSIKIPSTILFSAFWLSWRSHWFFHCGKPTDEHYWNGTCTQLSPCTPLLR